MRPSWRAGAAGLLAITLATAVLSGCVPNTAPESPSGPDTPASAPPSTQAAGASPSAALPSGPQATGSALPDTPMLSSAPPEPTTGPVSAAQEALDGLSLEQRVGQVLMMGIEATGVDAATLDTLTTHKVGNVFLKGRSSLGVAKTRALVEEIAATEGESTTGGLPRFVSTDQEGGKVQVLSGPGFSTMPSGIVQGSWSAAKLEASAGTWGRELADAGIHVNLAPVTDTVPSRAFAPSNAPIGYFGREFGFTPATVATHSLAFSAGMVSAGVEPVVKHFPGLGRVTANTDTTANVKDTQTTRNDPYLEPFTANINAGNRWVMVSNAYYTRIDPENIAPFSPVIMDQMLRGDEGFTGIIVSDDMCAARALSAWKYATRAKNFFNAGGTMMLCIDAAAIPAIGQGLVAEAKASPVFRAKIDAAALTVLEVKLG